jgi:hypothetical protein
MEKRGQGQIITVILIVLLVIAIVVIVWNVVIKSVEDSSGQVDVNPLLMDGEVEYWVADGTDAGIDAGDQMTVSVTKKAGGGNITGVKLVLEDDDGNVYTYDNYAIFPKDLETKSYIIALADVVPPVTGIDGFLTIAKVELYFNLGNEDAPEFTSLLATAEDVTGVSTGVTPADPSVTAPRGSSKPGGGSDSGGSDGGNDAPDVVCVDDDGDGLWDNCPNPPIVIEDCFDEFLAPVPICTCVDLQMIGNAGNFDKNYILMNDVDCSETTNFDPIGDISDQFEGSFDGNNFIISDLTINSLSENFAGLFGYTNVDANIHNVGLTNVDITGINFVGGLVGWNFGTIEDSYATGNINGNYYAGGLVGYNSGVIKNSYSTCDVSLNMNYAGGLVGYNINSVEDSYATGNINGNYGIGGLIGYNLIGYYHQDTAKVEDSFSVGDVSGSSMVGGLIGRNFRGNIINSYYYNSDENPSSCYGGGSGGCIGIDNNDNFYLFANEPLNSWDSGEWVEVINDYPILAWQ